MVDSIFLESTNLRLFKIYPKFLKTPPILLMMIPIDGKGGLKLKNFFYTILLLYSKFLIHFLGTNFEKDKSLLSG